MRGWMIAAAVLAVLAVLLLCPVRVTVRLEAGQWDWRVRYLLFSWRPQPEEQPSGETPGRPKKKKKKAAPPAPGKTQREKLREYYGYYKAAKPYLGRLASRLRRFFCRQVQVDHFWLRLRTSGENAAESAIRAGRANRLCYSLYAFASSLFTLRQVRFSILPDPLLADDELLLEGEASVRPLAVLGLAASLGGLLIRFALALKGKSNKTKPQQRKGPHYEQTDLRTD